MSKRYKIVIISVCAASAILFSLITILLYVNNLEPLNIDILIRDYAYQIRGTDGTFFADFMKFFTNFGIALIFIIGLIIIIVYRFRLGSIIILIGTALTWMLNDILKLFIMRERPNEEMRWLVEQSSSYPSGHSMVTAFFYWTLCFFVHIHIESKLNRQIMYISFCLIILLIGISRILLGMHYFTDVISGFALGLICSTIAIFIYEKTKIRNIKYENGSQF